MSLKEAAANSLLMFVAATCVVLIVKTVSPTPTVPSPNAAATVGPAPTPALPDGITVYYLHGNTRCPTCRTIESTAREAVESGFSEQLQSGQVRWQVINYETPGNEHYATDYEVVAPSVVLVRFDGGKRTAWKSLPEVWELVDDPAAFVDFVQKRLREFMGQSPASVARASNAVGAESNSGDAVSLPIPE